MAYFFLLKCSPIYTVKSVHSPWEDGKSPVKSQFKNVTFLKIIMKLEKFKRDRLLNVILKSGTNRGY